MHDVANRVLAAKDLIGDLLQEQQSLTAVDRFAQQHEGVDQPLKARFYRDLIPLERPAAGEQYAFEVDLDACSACKACVSACHSLNGLEVYESWRDIGSLLGDDGSRKTVTTACHHCAEPACADGCPVLAYEKDDETGIVRHLDDQCIGCRYCEMKCPYGVPKYSVRLGVVRKCDMCYDRLAAAEAPACVQACPSGAISIRIVDRNDVPDRGAMVPGAFDSSYTRPTTTFAGWKEEDAWRPANEADLRPAHAHLPLVLMLVFTQAAVGISVAAVVAQSSLFEVSAVVFGALGLGASILHLGQPLKAWRCFLGWRKSWLSREILAFGAWFPALALAALTESTAIGIAAVGLGFVGVACSVMVYADTRREFWSLHRTAGRFLGTAVLFAALALGGWWVALAIAIKFAAEASGFAVGGSRYLLLHDLARVVVVRYALVVLALIYFPFAPLVAAAALLAGELLERYLYFRAVVEPKMP